MWIYRITYYYTCIDNNENYDDVIFSEERNIEDNDRDGLSEFFRSKKFDKIDIYNIVLEYIVFINLHC